MVINKAISHLMKENKVTQLSMARSIGKERANEVSSRLSNGNMTFDRAIEMLEVMGYEVVIQKRKQGARGRDQIVLEMSTAAKPAESVPTDKPE